MPKVCRTDSAYTGEQSLKEFQTQQAEWAEPRHLPSSFGKGIVWAQLAEFNDIDLRSSNVRAMLWPTLV